MKYARFSGLILLLLAACSTQDPTPTTGSLEITVTGLSVPATIEVRGAGGFSQTVTGSTTLENLVPGTYTISAPEVTIAGARYASNPPLSSVEVVASATPTQKSVVYALAAHGLIVTVTGLPEGVQAHVEISGPQSFRRLIAATDTLWVAQVGTYTITAGIVQDFAMVYGVTPATSTATVTESEAPVVATVSYTLASAPLVITVSGLPDTAPASITVTGPGNFALTITATTTLWPWLPGSYVIQADDALVSNRTYEPVPAISTATVTSPATRVAVTVAYAAAAVARVTVSPATATASIGLVGVQLTASTEDARGHPLLNQVTWSSADTSIATVSSTGEVRAVSEGTTSVTATADGLSASAVITVPPATIYMLAGTWTFSLVARDLFFARCSDSGTLTIVQAPSSSTFAVSITQRGSCTVLGISTTISFPSPYATTGSAAGIISFSLGYTGSGGGLKNRCRLVGTADHEVADNMTGPVTCGIDVGAGSNRHYVGTLTGTWSAKRVQ